MVKMKTMIDIDYILGNSKKNQAKDPLRDLFGIKPSYRSKPKSNIVNTDFLSGFIGQGHPRKDYKTKQQKAFLKKTRIGSGKSHLRFMDLDGDGVISGLDCEYKNPKKHMPYLYSWRPQDETSETIRASESQKRMDLGRGTGWTGTGIYGYSSKESAESEGEAYKTIDYGKGPRVLKKVWSEKPKHLRTSGQYEYYERVSKNLAKLQDEDDPEIRDSLKSEIKRKMFIVDNEVSDEEIDESVDMAKKSGVEQPINFLMKKRGYDAVIADKDNDTYRKGSVYYGDDDSIKNKLEEVPDED